MKNRNSAGRPPKFDEESVAVTLTLPKRILQLISSVDIDRARGIVKCVDSSVDLFGDKKDVEIIEVNKNTGIIVIGKSASLRKISWLKLIEITPDRFMLAIPSGTSIDLLEIAVLDLLEELSSDEITEKHLLIQLRDTLRKYRNQEAITKGEILFVNAVSSFLLSIFLKTYDIAEFFCDSAIA